MTTLHFWNGNKSSVRQAYELSLLQRVMNITSGDYGHAAIEEDLTDYPRAEDEGSIFQKGGDLCVTVAGNPKFQSGRFIPVYDPIMDGLLGHRLLIIRQEDQPEFSRCVSAEMLRKKVMGIPETWADAPLFRSNGYPVEERGSFDELFYRLKTGEFDYVSMGVNEVFPVFAEKAAELGGLVIESSLRLYYPFALVFYVHPNQPQLAERLRVGLRTLRRSGEFGVMFQSYFQQLFIDADFQARRGIYLTNPVLPSELERPMEAAIQELSKWTSSSVAAG